MQLIILLVVSILTGLLLGWVLERLADYIVLRKRMRKTEY